MFRRYSPVLLFLVLVAPALASAWVEGAASRLHKPSSQTIGDYGCINHSHGFTHGTHGPGSSVNFTVRAQTITPFADLSQPIYSSSTCTNPGMSTNYATTGGFNIFLIRRTGDLPDGTDAYAIEQWWTPRNLSSTSSDPAIEFHRELQFDNPSSADYFRGPPGYYALVSCMYDVRASGVFLGFPWSSQPMTDTPYRCHISPNWHPVHASGNVVHAGPQVRLAGHWVADL